MSDESKKVSPEQPKDKIEDMKPKPISETDVQSVKGGAAVSGKYAK